jgi:hypothetical protein
MKPYHTLFLQVEYDVSYTGGDYAGTGVTVLVPAVLADVVGVGEAFRAVTGLDPAHVIHCALDDLYDAEGRPVTDWQDLFKGDRRQA